MHMHCRHKSHRQRQGRKKHVASDVVAGRDRDGVEADRRVMQEARCDAQAFVWCDVLVCVYVMVWDFCLYLLFTNAQLFTLHITHFSFFLVFEYF